MADGAQQPRSLPSFKPLDQVRPWNDRVQMLEVTMIVPEAPNVATFCFRTTDNSWFRYLPGQFITLELPVDGQKVLRTYTLSSSPSRPLSITVTVKASPDSVGTRWMLDNLKIGDRLKAFGPAGIFSFHTYPAEKYLFISAGSGITPMMSMTRWLYDYGLHTDITFIHAARRPSEIIFRSELEMMATRTNDMRLAWIVEGNDPFTPWAGFTGRINQLLLQSISPDYFEREIFCCGPPPFMTAVREILIASGFEMERYHEESFQAPVKTEQEAPDFTEEEVALPDAEAEVELVFTQSGQSVQVPETTTILEAAKAAGLFIPNACNFGVCGTCKIMKRSGDVHMVHNGGISEEEEAEGYILACCSKPLSRVEVEI